MINRIRGTDLYVDQEKLDHVFLNCEYLLSKGLLIMQNDKLPYFHK